MSAHPQEQWEVGEAYDRYVGRWSRPVARTFLSWLAIPGGRAWADIGCGTGALVGAILADCAPRAVLGIDRSAGFIATGQRELTDVRAQFLVGEAAQLPLDAARYDVTVSGLVLNFVDDPARMLREMIRVTKPGGKVAAYVWDYAAGMAMMRLFWDAAVAVSPDDAALDEAGRFPLCQPEALTTLWQDSGLEAVAVRAIDIPTVFQDFDDYWRPFLGRQGAAPAYLASVSPETQEQIRKILQARLGSPSEGKLALTARAWAVQGVVGD